LEHRLIIFIAGAEITLASCALIEIATLHPSGDIEYDRGHPAMSLDTRAPEMRYPPPSPGEARATAVEVKNQPLRVGIASGEPLIHGPLGRRVRSTVPVLSTIHMLIGESGPVFLRSSRKTYFCEYSEKRGVVTTSTIGIALRTTPSPPSVGK
jgi:hypothetical protein